MSSFHNIPSATIETTLRPRPRSPLTVPTITHEDAEDCVSTNSPPVSIWSADASLATSEQYMVEEDELYIRRVFSFDEWEYNHPQHNVKSPLHREPISSNDMNRYNDSLKSLIQLPERTSTTTPSLFQEIWDKKLMNEDSCGLGYHTSPSFTATTTVSTTSPETTPIPSPESAFRQFQTRHVSPIDTTTTSTTLFNTSAIYETPWCPSIPRESSEGSFVHIGFDASSSSSCQDDGNRQQQHPQSSNWSVPEYVLVPQDSMMEEEEIEL
mmetsp:Transcript_32449/g.78791  ORF Transcript_32449/g.78791 Transcript_32449/m.78791 type:complete len:268 (-) Transcript_32449:70-873(-)